MPLQSPMKQRFQGCEMFKPIFRTWQPDANSCLKNQPAISSCMELAMTDESCWFPYCCCFPGAAPWDIPWVPWSRVGWDRPLFDRPLPSRRRRTHPSWPQHRSNDRLIHQFMYTYMYMYLFMYMQMQMYIKYVYTNKCMYIYMYIYIFTHIKIHLHIYIYW